MSELLKRLCRHFSIRSAMSMVLTLTSGMQRVRNAVQGDDEDEDW